MDNKETLVLLVTLALMEKSDHRDHKVLLELLDVRVKQVTPPKLENSLFLVEKQETLVMLDVMALTAVTAKTECLDIWVVEEIRVHVDYLVLVDLTGV